MNYRNQLIQQADILSKESDEMAKRAKQFALDAANLLAEADYLADENVISSPIDSDVKLKVTKSGPAAVQLFASGQDARSVDRDGFTYVGLFDGAALISAIRDAR